MKHRITSNPKTGTDTETTEETTMTRFTAHTFSRLGELFREHVVLPAEVDPTVAGYAATRGPKRVIENERQKGDFPDQQSPVA